jgi:hypothetical protein
MVHIKIVKIVNYLAIAITSQSKENVGGCGLKVRQKGPKKAQLIIQAIRLPV